MAHGISPLDTAHRGPIHAAQLDHFGRRLATASEDHCVRVWDVEARCFVTELKGHKAPVWAVSWSHPMYGPVLASAGEDRKVLLWREAEGEWCLIHSHEMQGAALSAAFSPWEYGLQLAVASSDGQVAVVSLREPEPAPSTPLAAPLQQPLARWHSSSPRLAPSTPPVPASPVHRGTDDEGASEHTKVSDRWRVETFRAHEGGCFALCWAPAASPAVVASAAGAESQRAASAATSSGAGVAGGDAGTAATAEGADRSRSTVLQPRRLVTGGADNQVRIWRHDKQTSAWADQHHFPSDAHSDWVRDVAWRPNAGIPANTIASCAEDGTVVIWRQAMIGQPWGRQEKLKLDASAWQVSWSVTGSILAVSTSSNQVLLYKELLDGSWDRAEMLDELGTGEAVRVDDLEVVDDTMHSEELQ